MSRESCGLVPDTQSWLRFIAPKFAVNAKSVEILHTPVDFHSELIKKALNAKRRIVLATLYLGNGPLESKLVDSICQAAKKNGLSVTMLFDFVRGSRGQKNSIDMIKPLLDHFGKSDKLKVSLYHTPNLRGLYKRFLPERWNETIGVAHMKAFIFDDDLIISGANLSHDYFVDRQDRYMVFNNCSQLANYFNDVIDTIGSFSFVLAPNGQLEMPKGISHPYEGNMQEFISDSNQRVIRIIQSYLSPNMRYYLKKYCQIPPKVSTGFLSSIMSRYISSNASQDNFFQTDEFEMSDDMQNNNISLNSERNGNDTWVFPTVQMGLLGIRQDELAMNLFFKSVAPDTKVCFTTGYFNVTDEYCNMMVQSNSKYDIMLSSPEANGFYGSQGFSKHIPQVYVHLCKMFFNKVVDARRMQDFSFLEYIRNGWTFHGKGMWCYPPGEKHPSMTIIGSSNFGLRSVHRDLEAQLFLVTSNQELKEKLHNEKNNILKYTRPIKTETFKQRRYFVPRWVAFVTNFIKMYF